MNPPGDRLSDDIREARVAAFSIHHKSIHQEFQMIKNVFARYLVLLFVGGSALGGAAVGLAGLAGAA
jgi:hypothetical protein